MKILLLCLLLLPAQAFAEKTYIFLSRNYSLPKGEGANELKLSFEEARPGRPSLQPLGEGCSLHIRSRGNFVMMGRYTVGLEESRAPGPVDHRWWRQFTVWASGFDMRVLCQSSHEIDDNYIHHLMGGYARVERE